MTTCRSCGAPIRWVKMKTGKRMPLDAEPDIGRGNLIILWGDRGAVLSGEELEAAAATGTPLYTSHFATCPHAAAHRQPKQPKEKT